MTTIYSINADGQVRYDTVLPERIAKKIKMLQNQGQLDVRVISEPKTNQLQTQVPQLETDDVEVAPGLFQSREDFEANVAYDEWKDNNL
jgi:hypothetical protein